MKNLLQLINQVEEDNRTLSLHEDELRNSIINIVHKDYEDDFCHSKIIMVEKNTEKVYRNITIWRYGKKIEINNVYISLKDIYKYYYISQNESFMYLARVQKYNKYEDSPVFYVVKKPLSLIKDHVTLIDHFNRGVNSNGLSLREVEADIEDVANNFLSTLINNVQPNIVIDLKSSWSIGFQNVYLFYGNHGEISYGLHSTTDYNEEFGCVDAGIGKDCSLLVGKTVVGNPYYSKDIVYNKEHCKLLICKNEIDKSSPYSYAIVKSSLCSTSSLKAIRKDNDVICVRDID